MAATLHPLPRYVSADEAPPDPSLNPTRQRLAEAIAALDRARGEAELAAGPVRRLSDVIAEYDRLEAQVREVDDRDQSAIGPWIMPAFETSLRSMRPPRNPRDLPVRVALAVRVGARDLSQRPLGAALGGRRAAGQHPCLAG